MDPKHIEEYVARRVIMHMKYRDTEIAALQKELEILREELEEFDIILCSWCHKYRKYDRTCEFCDRQSCIGCGGVKNYSSWNLSGCNACDECEKKILHRL